MVSDLQGVLREGRNAQQAYEVKRTRSAVIRWGEHAQGAAPHPFADDTTLFRGRHGAETFRNAGWLGGLCSRDLLRPVSFRTWCAWPLIASATNYRSCRVKSTLRLARMGGSVAETKHHSRQPPFADDTKLIRGRCFAGILLARMGGSVAET